MKRIGYGIIVVGLFLALTTTALAAPVHLAWFPSEKAINNNTNATNKYPLPSWAATRPVRCIVKENAYPNGTVFYTVWGVWGKKINGTKICYVPNRRSARKNLPTNNGGGLHDDKTTPTCHEETTCTTNEREVCDPPVCDEERTCLEWNYEETCTEPACETERYCERYDYEWKWVKNHCEARHTGNDCACTSHNHQNCHLEKVRGNCEEWSERETCEQPICHEEQTTCKTWSETTCDEPVCRTVSEETCTTKNVCT